MPDPDILALWTSLIHPESAFVTNLLLLFWSRIDIFIRDINLHPNFCNATLWQCLLKVLNK